MEIDVEYTTLGSYGIPMGDEDIKEQLLSSAIPR